MAVPRIDAQQQLERLHSTARLGWDGAAKEFALLELYPVRVARDLLYEPWDGRGPVYGTGWDPMMLAPVWLINLEPSEIHSMDFLAKIKRWLRPMKDRILESARAEGQKADDDITDISGQAGERLYWEAHHAIDSGPIVAQRFVTDYDKAVLAGETITSVKDMFIPAKRDGTLLQ